MINILQECDQYNFVFDKTTQTYDELPYEKEEILLPPNEFVKGTTFNKKLFNLHYNFLFLYKLCNFADFLIPKTSIFSFSGSDTRLYESNFRKNIITGNTNFSRSNKGAVSFYDVKAGKTVLFYTTDKEIFSCLIDRNGVEVRTSTRFIDPLSGSIVFNRITDIKVNKNNDLYVVDNGYQNIYYYNATPVIRGDSIYRKLPFLVNVVGGEGPIYENTKFGNINNIAVNSNYVIAEDNINKCFKVFDKNLNWLKTVPLKTFFDSVIKLHGMVLDEKNILYTISGVTMYVFQIEESTFNVRLIKTVNIRSYIREDETVLNMSLASQDENVCYVFTDKGIKKFWTTDPSGCIGEFLTENNILWGSTFKSNFDGFDTIIVRTEDSYEIGSPVILGFNDDLNINNLLVNRDFEIFSFNDLQIKSNEYVTNWVIQKSIRKIFYNINILLKEIKFRLVEDDRTISVIVDRVYNQIFTNYASKAKDPPNLDIGINEIFQAEVVNRLLSELLLLQQTILYYVVNNQKLKKYLSPRPDKEKKQAIRYAYYSDGSVNLSPNPAALSPLENILPLDGIVVSLGGAPYSSGEGITVISDTDF